MPHNPDDMGSAREWIRRARSNLVRAEPVTEEEFRQAVATAETVVAWAVSQIRMT